MNFLLIHPTWKAWSTKSWPELPTLNTFKYRNFPRQQCQHKSWHTIYHCGNIVQRFISKRLHRPAALTIQIHNARIETIHAEETNLNRVPNNESHNLIRTKQRWAYSLVTARTLSTKRCILNEDWLFLIERNEWWKEDLIPFFSWLARETYHTRLPLDCLCIHVAPFHWECVLRVQVFSSYDSCRLF